MARKLNKPLDVEDVELGEESGEDEQTHSADSSTKPISKAGAARAALALGYRVPKQASAYIKQKYGIDISPQQFSAEKSRIKLRSGGDQPFPPRGPGSFAAEGALGVRRGDPGQADFLQALEVMKPLIDQLGAEKVKRMVDLLN